MDKEAIARKLLIEQTKKELLDRLKQYLAGRCVNGTLIAFKSIEFEGYVFVMPDEIYKELYGK